MSSIEGIEDPFGPGTAGGTALLEREETQLSEPGDHERFSHYVCLLYTSPSPRD